MHVMSAQQTPDSSMSLSAMELPQQQCQLGTIKSISFDAQARAAL
jgi:hypothetical protein